MRRGAGGCGQRMFGQGVRVGNGLNEDVTSLLPAETISR